MPQPVKNPYKVAEALAFAKKVRSCIIDDLQKNQKLTQVQISRELNISYNTLKRAFGLGRVGSSAYQRLCERWPTLRGLDPKRLPNSPLPTAGLLHAAGAPTMTAALPSVPVRVVTTPRGRTMMALPGVAPPDGLEMLELGYLIRGLRERPDSDGWVEVLEMSEQRGIPFTQVIALLRAPRAEVSRAG